MIRAAVGCFGCSLEQEGPDAPSEVEATDACVKQAERLGWWVLLYDKNNASTVSACPSCKDAVRKQLRPYPKGTPAALRRVK